MVRQFEHATCLSLTMNCSDFLEIASPQSQHRLVSIEMIFAVIGVTRDIVSQDGSWSHPWNHGYISHGSGI